jgi:two-component system OmpR family sensor kinase
VRDRLLVAVLLTVAAALITSTVAFNLLLSVSFRSDADSRLRKLADDTNKAITIVDNRVSFPKPTGDIKELGSTVWVFWGDQGATVSGPDVDPVIETAAKSLNGKQAQYLNLPEKQVRFFAVPIMDNKADPVTGEVKRLGTIVSALWMGSYARTQRIALLATAALTAVLLIVVGFAGRWVLNAAFRPVARMTSEAEAWSTEDLDRRFGLGEPHDEVTHLAHTLDGLLDRLAASLQREQRFSAEVSHQLRTPLAKIKGEAELALRRQRTTTYYKEALASVSQSADQMARTVETLMAAAQKEGVLARGRADAKKVLDEVARSVAVLAQDGSVEVAVDASGRDLKVGVGTDIVAQILQPVVENACRFARHKVVLSAARKGKDIFFTVEDDGPGVSEDEKDRIFEPGIRGSAAAKERTPSRGAGLGLALARRLARAATGEVELGPSLLGTGARFIVRLPAG